ncbi:hypothetical protein F4813DRAFT_343176 [Daldinia decipiens]|uniref:uncharacterized protein n=1 Tax=Daldinia decipiens TaxID=326647 RepID=UPI0020C41F1D|nr:uncharacterized protein F4813DRAFT_343176 [Daldinia decipiens]KAI1662003.1 hypothetical protein F4813DRAFT_343176 [Daldinia decipiens]
MAPKRAYKRAGNRPTKGQKPKSLLPLFCVSLMLWIIIAVISIYIAAGCLYGNSLYIVQVHSNDTTPVQVQLGYFGTCVSTNTNADDVHSNTTKTACVQHLKYDDDEPLVSQFAEEMREENDNTGVPAIEESLSKILPVAEQLRRKVFPAGVPISFIIIYLLSIVSFWILLASSNHSKTYKAVFAVTALLNSYGLTIGFIVATTTWQACRALIFPAQDNTGTIQEGVFVTQNTLLQKLQWVVVGVSVVLQLCIAGLFVQRRASGGEASLKPSINIKNYKLCC